MSVSKSQVEPQELIRFRGPSTNVPLADIEILERSENRKPTNVLWSKILGVLIVVWLPFMIYTLCYSDIDRVIKGYDECGNICGKENYRWSNISCSGKNWILYPYLQYNYSFLESSELILQERHCVQSCDKGYTFAMGTCFKIVDDNEWDTSSENDFDLGANLNDVQGQIIISCLFSILVAMGVLFLFKFTVGFVVWSFLIGCYLGFVIITALFWYGYLAAPENYKDSFLICSIIFTIVAMILGFILFWFRKRVKLVIMILKEATKAIFGLPGLIALPVICILVIVILTFILGIMFRFMSTAGILQPLQHDSYDYVFNPVMIFTMIYIFVIYVWLTQILTGIQYMVIAGAVSKWYFCRDKIFLRSPILSSASIAFRYHLGTVTFGGLVITLVQGIKWILYSLIQRSTTFFKFLSKNAYIITAIHGEALLTSGKRAAKLLLQNKKDTLAINYVGNFVLLMNKILIVLITILISMVIFAIAPGNVWDINLSAYVIIGIVSIIVTWLIFAVFETTIDTLFLCYCEDNLLNDGEAHPYFMSRNLMEFVETSKKLHGKIK